MKSYIGKRNREEFLDLAAGLAGMFCLAIDTETIGLNGDLIGVGIAPDPYEAFWFSSNEDWKSYIGDIGIFQNAKYDLQYITIPHFEDTYLLALAQGEEVVNLKSLAMDKLLRELKTTKDLLTEFKAKDLTGVPEENVALMCMSHAMATYGLWEQLSANIPQVYLTIDKPMVAVLRDMERRGLWIDNVELAKQTLEQSNLKDTFETQFRSLTGVVNINSNPQLSKYFNSPNVDKTYLNKLATVEANALIGYRKAQKALSTYLFPFRELQDKNNIIHSSFDYTRTGRLRSEYPDTQNLTNGELRKIIAARPGHIFIGMDYNQLELRVLAELSRDKVMMDAFFNHEDLHLKTAVEVLHNHKLRTLGKKINFAAIYGASPSTLAREAGCSVEEGALIQKSYYDTYPGFAEFVRQTRKDAREKHYAINLFGRRRNISELTMASANMREKGLREAVNTPVQSTAADIVKLAMLDIYKEGLPMILQIHDELIFEVEECDVKSTVAKLSEIISSQHYTKVPITVTVKTGKNYLEVH